MSPSSVRISVVLQSTKPGALDKRLWLRARGGALLAMKTGTKVRGLHVSFSTVPNSGVVCSRQKEGSPFLWTYHVVQNALLFLLSPSTKTVVSLCRHTEQPFPLDWKRTLLYICFFHKLCYTICVWLLLVMFIRRRQWHPTPVLLPGKSHGRRSLVGCSPWGR